MSMAPERGILGIRRHFTTDGTDPYDDMPRSTSEAPRMLRTVSPRYARWLIA